jgi:hypothetical protein
MNTKCVITVSLIICQLAAVNVLAQENGSRHAVGVSSAQQKGPKIHPEGQAQNVDPSAALTDGSCDFNFAIGTGPARLVWCVSSTANLLRFESPEGITHLREGLREGYALCTTREFIGDTVRGFDNGVTGAGFGAPVLLSASTSSVSIRRFTTDGAFQLDHTFTRDLNEKDVTITATIKNISGGPIDGVAYSRFADLDVGGDAGDDIMDTSTRSVWARDLQSSLPGDAVVLTATSFGTFAFTAANRFAKTSFSTCLSPNAPAPLSAADNAAHISYDIGGLDAGQTRKVTFTYRRQ